MAEGSRVSGADDELQFDGFDGIGGSQADYAPAEASSTALPYSDCRSLFGRTLHRGYIVLLTSNMGATSMISAQVAQVSIDMEGGLAALKIEGFEEPLGLAIGLPEAAALLYASGIESRRPTTLKTWRHSLEAGFDCATEHPA